MEICVLRKLLFGGSPLEIVTGNASVHLLKITGEKNQSLTILRFSFATASSGDL